MILLILLVVVVLGSGGLLLAILLARFSDGPIGPIAGGAFRTGERGFASSIDWSELAAARHVELQLVHPPSSRTTNFLVLGGVPHIPCGIVKAGNRILIGQALWKRWHRDVEADPRVVLRIENVLYEFRAARITDPATHGALSALLSEKYDFELHEPIAMESAWFYRLDSAP